jgi:cobalt-precorrin-5B (C1)-methyltransferase
MELKEYIEKGGQKLRLGYTTGSCAAAASKAAVIMLLTGRKVPQVRLLTPGGRKLILDIEDICFREGGSVSCAVRKDSGDDPDITNHTLIYAEAALSATPGIRIDGGEGVGRVTKPGLDQPVGNAAINSTPRKMIREAVLEAMQYARDHCDPGTDLS